MRSKHCADRSNLMNMNESDFEKELRALQPLAPSAQLAERIETELRESATMAIAPAAARTPATIPAAGTLAHPAKTSPWLVLLRGLAWAGAGATAALAILFSREWANGNRYGGAQIANIPAQLEVQNVAAGESVSEFISARDEGLHVDENSAEPQRQMKVTYLERYTWTNPETGAVIEFEVPREDTVLMPVAMQ